MTGHSGFKGSWLCLVLHYFGAQLMGFALPPQETTTLFTIGKIKKLLKNRFGDVRDLNELKKQVLSFQPEIVFHLAAQSLVRRSYRLPVETFSTNVLGTVNVLETCRRCACTRAVVVVTTDKVYLNNEKGNAFTETAPLGGHDPYSASKAAAEMVVSSYRKSFFVREGKGVSAARAGNVIGGGDWSEDRIFPDAVRAWQVGQKLEVRNPNATRPWQHVLEPICGYISLAENIFKDPSMSSDFNFGPDPEGNATVREVIEMARDAFGSGKVEWSANLDKLYEAKTLCLDNSKAYKILGIKPVWNLRTSVNRTMDWYRRYLKSEDAQTLCKSDLEAFLKS